MVCRLWQHKVDFRKEMVYKIPFNTNSDFISDKASNDVGQVCSAGRDGH